ncbi:hypothetical protein I4U23_014155 [Adineta vaga]|nr:hypothetical protein I4U23_014155 [Adineta vaga]
MSRTFKTPAVNRVLIKNLHHNYKNRRPSTFNDETQNKVHLPRRSRSNIHVHRAPERNNLLSVKLEDIQSLEPLEERVSFIGLAIIVALASVLGVIAMTIVNVTTIATSSLQTIDSSSFITILNEITTEDNIINDFSTATIISTTLDLIIETSEVTTDSVTSILLQPKIISTVANTFDEVTQSSTLDETTISELNIITFETAISLDSTTSVEVESTITCMYNRIQLFFQ